MGQEVFSYFPSAVVSAGMELTFLLAAGDVLDLG